MEKTKRIAETVRENEHVVIDGKKLQCCIKIRSPIDMFPLTTGTWEGSNQTGFYEITHTFVSVP